MACSIDRLNCIWSYEGSESMHPHIEQLLVLQDRDRRILALQREKKALPGERAQIQSRLEAARQAFEQAREKSRGVEMERKKLELEAQSKRDSIGKFKAQQSQTRRNEEYQALSGEILRYEDMIKEIEDRELDLMEQYEKLKVDLAAAEKTFKEAEAQAKEAMSSLESKEAAIGSQLSELESGKAALSEGLPSDLLYRYNRLLVSKGDRAVVGIDHDVCNGCHMKITTQTVVRVKSGKEIVSCEQCGRILFWDEPA
jgi:predicted  nucleic acid-binding Zn-ribbon protein